MKIFNQKNVIGLFDRDKDVEKVVDALQKRGFGEDNDDEIRIIDRHRLPQEIPVDVPEQQIIPQTGTGHSPLPGPGGTMFDPIDDAGIESESIQDTVREYLVSMGLGDEEARFHAMHVARGSSLVVVDTTKDRAVEAEEVMSQVHSVVSEA